MMTADGRVKPASNATRGRTVACVAAANSKRRAATSVRRWANSRSADGASSASSRCSATNRSISLSRSDIATPQTGADALAERAVQPRDGDIDGVERPAQLGGDLLTRQIMHIAQRQQFTRVLGQAVTAAH